MKMQSTSTTSKISSNRKNNTNFSWKELEGFKTETNNTSKLKKQSILELTGMLTTLIGIRKSQKTNKNLWNMPVNLQDTKLTLFIAKHRENNLKLRGRTQIIRSILALMRRESTEVNRRAGSTSICQTLKSSSSARPSWSSSLWASQSAHLSSSPIQPSGSRVPCLRHRSQSSSTSED